VLIWPTRRHDFPWPNSLPFHRLNAASGEASDESHVLMGRWSLSCMISQWRTVPSPQT
jgi:hypothetical protein